MTDTVHQDEINASRDLQEDTPRTGCTTPPS
jgi:hypothetical protein